MILVSEAVWFDCSFFFNFVAYLEIYFGTNKDDSR